MGKGVPHALLIKFPGTNCDRETARALEGVGFAASIRPVAVVEPQEVRECQLLVLPGGFSYGDYVMAGRLAEMEMERRLGDTLQEYHGAGGHILGICNGFQILTRTGLLPEASLVNNVSGRFVCRWTGLTVRAGSNAFLQGLPEEIELPVAHAEGRLVTRTPELAKRYGQEGRVALTYQENFNGSFEAIAGLQDGDGRVLGLMPHPERFTDRRQHYDPGWDRAERGWGYYVFRSIRERLREA
jgi:phosphoribosylformylglycinamidine synthase subunit PurQ / glutaminase